MDYTVWAYWYDLIYSLAPSGDMDFYARLAREAVGRPLSSRRPEARTASAEGPSSIRSRNSDVSILELGVGTGRIAIPIALAGANITAIDLQTTMLDMAEAKALSSGLAVRRNGRRRTPKDTLRPQLDPPATIEFIQADMRTLELGRSFPLITIPSNTLLLATTKRDQLSTLKRAAAHLFPGGLLTFDIFNPTSDLLSDREEAPFFWGETVNPENGRTCRVYAINRIDIRRQLNRGTQIIEELPGDLALPAMRRPYPVEGERAGASGEAVRRIELDILIRYLHPAEAHLLIESAGLAVTALYGDFDLSPFTISSPRMVFVCVRRR
ncbi:MAG: class I SAM-dependent methyltransferase [Dehalococcoidia bacterium]|nr:class I SAM-dependent methyltransferase [Dehalococcoidia bacterium]